MVMHKVFYSWCGKEVSWGYGCVDVSIKPTAWSELSPSVASIAPFTHCGEWMLWGAVSHSAPCLPDWLEPTIAITLYAMDHVLCRDREALPWLNWGVLRCRKKQRSDLCLADGWVG